jgi:hypothetical protein
MIDPRRLPVLQAVATGGSVAAALRKLASTNPAIRPSVTEREVAAVVSAAIVKGPALTIVALLQSSAAGVP